MSIFKVLAPAPYKPMLPPEEVQKKYPRMRKQVFLAITIGYAACYLVRNNFGLAIPLMINIGYSKANLGFIASAYAAAYGWSKFVMGNFSDRCNPRYFMAVGLFLSGIVNLLFPVMSGVSLMYCMMFMNGWFGGMGYPPCGRTMAHWFSINERGTKMSVWNCSHNIGGGIIAPIAGWALTLMTIIGYSSADAWKGIFYVPGVLAIILSVFIAITLRDTPQSEGLPPIEEYRNNYALATKHLDSEREMSPREVLFKHVLSNKNIWFLALSNVFVYTVRYGALTWAPLYLISVKHISFSKASWSYFFYEYAGIIGTIACGWLSEKYFNSRRGPSIAIFMLGALISMLIYWNMGGENALSYTLILACIGLFVYGPVGLIGVNCLDYVPKKAAGTATGFTGLFGYLFGTTGATWFMGLVMDKWGWDAGFMVLVGACVLSILFILPTWKVQVLDNKKEDVKKDNTNKIADPVSA